MLTRPTLLVVGAGASKELKFPTGPELAADIAKDLAPERRLDPDGEEFEELSDIARTMLNRTQRPIDWMRVCGALARGLPYAASIDTYLDHHADPEFEFVGKLAIARRILDYERESCLFCEDYELPGPSFPESHETWLRRLFGILRAKTPKPFVDSFFDNLSMVVFNYDRCIERYFTQAIRMYYEIDFEHAAEIVKKANILHAYGSLGELPSRRNGYGPSVVKFGDTTTPLTRRVSEIRTFAESSQDDSIKQKIFEAENAAELIVFLGFGYLSENLDLIRTIDRPHPVNVLGTTYKLPSDYAQKVREKLALRFSRTQQTLVILENSTCSTFLDDNAHRFQ